MTDSIHPIRHTENLAKGRVSLAEARYFLTCCTTRPTNFLVEPAVAAALLQVWSEMEQQEDFHVLAANIMPDHVHLLIHLEERLTISQVIGKFKTLSRHSAGAALAAAAGHASSTPTKRLQFGAVGASLAKPVDGSRASASDAPTTKMPDYWQRNFFEHRLRPDERSDPFARYIFLNPYRAKLIARQEEWLFWFRSATADFDFLHLLKAGRFPPAEWLNSELKDFGLTEESVGSD